MGGKHGRGRSPSPARSARSVSASAFSSSASSGTEERVNVMPPPPTGRPGMVVTLRVTAGQEDSLVHSHRPGKAVAEPATAGATTLADEQATGGCRCHWSSRARQHPSTGDTSSHQQRPHSHIPLRHRPRQAEEQPDEVQQRGCGMRDGATLNRKGRLHRRPRVAAIPATPSRPPTPLP